VSDLPATAQAVLDSWPEGGVIVTREQARVLMEGARLPDPAAPPPPSGDAPGPDWHARTNCTITDPHYHGRQYVASGDALRAVTDFLDKYGLANTSGPRHVARQEALRKARAALATPAPLTFATDVGVYPASSPDGPRTEWQEGWNAAVTAMETEAATPAPLDPMLLAMAMDRTDDEDERLGVVGRGTKVDRILAEYRRIVAERVASRA
jgi:hypothetical protein